MGFGTPTQVTQNTANSGVINAAPGRLLKLNATNNNVAARYIMIFDATAVPAAGAKPKECLVAQSSAGVAGQSPVVAPSGGTLAADLGPNGVQCDVGICWAASTTPDVLTPITSADTNVTAWFA